MLNRRQKYTGSSNKNKATITKEEHKVNLDLDLSSLNLFCSYLVSSNKNIKRSQVINIRKFFDVLDLTAYSDDERQKRINFIMRALEARLDCNLTDPAMIKAHINGGLVGNDLLDYNCLQELSNSELEWMNGSITTTLNNAYMYRSVDSLIDVLLDFKNCDYREKDSKALAVRNRIAQTQSEFRQNDARASSDVAFCLRPEVFENYIKQIHEELSNPSRKLKTGMVAFNEMLNGGFESQRVYSIFGLPSEGKSTTLLDLAVQIKRYNKDYIPKDPTKKPCVVLLTMENGIRETVERLWEMLLDKEDMCYYTAEEAITILQTEGKLQVTPDDPIDLYIKYVPGESVDTNYLYTLADDLEDEGYEIIVLVQDYLKRIRSCFGYTEPRMIYGSVVNEFKIFATLRDIPVITASQLNREATKHIDEGRKTNKADLLRLFGRSNIGESQLILENLDAAYFIVPERDFDGHKHLGIQKVKSRFYSSIDWLYMPYTDYSEIKFIEDVELKMPVHKFTLRADANLDHGGQNVMPMNTVKTLDNIMLLKDLDNTFSKGSSYSSSNNVGLGSVASMMRVNEPKPALIREPLRPGLLKIGLIKEDI